MFHVLKWRKDLRRIVKKVRSWAVWQCSGMTAAQERGGDFDRVEVPRFAVEDGHVGCSE